MRLCLLFVALTPVWPQSATTLPTPLPTCNAPLWSPCDLAFPLQPGEETAPFRVQFRSPHKDTRTVPGFVDSGRMIVRFTPDEVGLWDYRVTSSLPRVDGQRASVTGMASNAPGFVRVANIHHFDTSNGQPGNQRPHLWMGSAIDKFVTMPRAEFDRTLAARAAEKFTHIRVTIEPATDLREAAERIRAIHDKGLVTDVALTTIPAARREREQYLTEMIARFGAFNITWALPAYETTPRAVLREAGTFLAANDPFKHPRTAMAEFSSSPLLEDMWMSMTSFGSADPNVGAPERVTTRVPSINTGVKTRADLWNATMSGEYPSGAASVTAKEATVWFDLLSRTRDWEMEPYYELTGGRAIAVREVELRADDVIDSVEYLIYVEKPGPVEVKVQKQKYSVTWIDPATGERVEGKDFKEEMFTGAPPNNNHDWVLHLSRDGHKDGMLKSYKFESRPVLRQQAESGDKTPPFEIDAPSGDISLSKPVPFELKITRASKATRNMLVEWTAELVSGGDGPRVVGMGLSGTLHLPASFTARGSGTISLRASVVNANGKLYYVDRILRLVP